MNAFNPPKDAPFAGKANQLKLCRGGSAAERAYLFHADFRREDGGVENASAVAELGSSKGCIYSLALLGGITVNGTVNAPDCGVVDNAILTVGGGCITASSIGVVLNLLGGGCTNPQPILGIAPSADPLGYLPRPRTPPLHVSDYGGCEQQREEWEQADYAFAGNVLRGNSNPKYQHGAGHVSARGVLHYRRSRVGLQRLGEYWRRRRGVLSYRMAHR